MTRPGTATKRTFWYRNLWTSANGAWEVDFTVSWLGLPLSLMHDVDLVEVLIGPFVIRWLGELARREQEDDSRFKAGVPRA